MKPVHIFLVVSGIVLVIVGLLAGFAALDAAETAAWIDAAYRDMIGSSVRRGVDYTWPIVWWCVAGVGGVLFVAGIVANIVDDSRRRISRTGA